MELGARGFLRIDPTRKTYPDGKPFVIVSGSDATRQQGNVACEDRHKTSFTNKAQHEAELLAGRRYREEAARMMAAVKPMAENRRVPVAGERRHRSAMHPEDS